MKYREDGLGYSKSVDLGDCRLYRRQAAVLWEIAAINWPDREYGKVVKNIFKEMKKDVDKGMNIYYNRHCKKHIKKHIQKEVKVCYYQRYYLQQQW